RAPPAPATRGRRDLPDHGVRPHAPPDEVVRGDGEKGALPLQLRAEHRDAGAHPLAQPVTQSARFVDAVDLHHRGNHLRTVDRNGATEEPLREVPSPRRTGTLQLPVQLPVLLDQAVDPGEHVLLARTQQLGQLPQHSTIAQPALVRLLTRHRLDTPNAGRYPGFCYDPARTA